MSCCWIMAVWNSSVWVLLNLKGCMFVSMCIFVAGIIYLYTWWFFLFFVFLMECWCFFLGITPQWTYNNESSNCCLQYTTSAQIHTYFLLLRFSFFLSVIVYSTCLMKICFMKYFKLILSSEPIWTSMQDADSVVGCWIWH